MRPEHDGALGADSVEHRPHVLHARLERSESATAALRDARPPLVEQDQSERAREPLVELAQIGRLPVVHQVRHVLRDVDEVTIAVADDVVRDRDVAVARIANIWLHEDSLLDFGRADNGARSLLGAGGLLPRRHRVKRRGARPCTRRDSGIGLSGRAGRWRRGRLPRNRRPPDSYTSSVATTAAERRLYLDGEWIETGEWLDVRSPYSGDVVGHVTKGGAAETRRAIDAAERASGEPLPAHKRAEILVRIAGMLGRRHDEAAHLIASEAGKPMKASRVEAKRAMSTYTFAAVEARKLAGEMVPMDASQAGEGKLAFTLREPVGIVGAISPFNFPLNLVAHKIAPALAAGCAVVLKPAGQTPLSALLLAELEEEAGLPAGWLNVVAGSSSEIGDVLVVGDPADEETDVGPVIDDDARRRILEWVDKSGGELLTGGETNDRDLIKPTVIANPAPDAQVSREEVFGPVVTLTRTGSLDEAIELANSTRYGLQAAIFTAEIEPAMQAARRLEFGGVIINEAPTFRADQMPYGGVKASGNTREGPLHAVREMTEERLVVLQL